MGFSSLTRPRPNRLLDACFEGVSGDELRISGKLSPRVLVVAPGQHLSWQHYRRRAEIWRVVQGPVGVATSDDDEQGNMKSVKAGESINEHGFADFKGKQTWSPGGQKTRLPR